MTPTQIITEAEKLSNRKLTQQEKLLIHAAYNFGMAAGMKQAADQLQTIKIK